MTSSTLEKSGPFDFTDKNYFRVEVIDEKLNVKIYPLPKKPSGIKFTVRK